MLSLSLIHICQPEQIIELGKKAPETNSEQANPEERHDDDVCEYT